MKIGTYLLSVGFRLRNINWDWLPIFSVISR